MPSKTAFATSLASARVGRVLCAIDWSISVATMTGRRTRAPAQDLPLDDGHALGRELDAEIAARDHDAVGGGDDALEVLDRVGRLDLGDDGRGLAPVAGDVADEAEVSARRTNESAT